MKRSLTLLANFGNELDYRFAARGEPVAARRNVSPMTAAARTRATTDADLDGVEMTRAKSLQLRYGVSLALLYKWAADGTLPSRRIGRVRLFDAQAAHALLGSRK